MITNSVTHPSAKEALFRLSGFEPQVMGAIQTAIAKNRPTRFTYHGVHMKVSAWDHDAVVISAGLFGRHYRSIVLNSN